MTPGAVDGVIGMHLALFRPVTPSPPRFRVKSVRHPKHWLCRNRTPAAAIMRGTVLDQVLNKEKNDPCDDFQ